MGPDLERAVPEGFLLGIRELGESALVVAVVILLVLHLGREGDRSALRNLMVVTVVLVSITVAWMLVSGVRLSDQVEDIVEGGLMLGAAATVLIAIHGLRLGRNGRSHTAGRLGLVLGLGVLLVVMREFPETIVQVADEAGPAGASAFVGLFAGLIVAAAISVGVILALAALPWRALSILFAGMILFGAGLSSRAVEELATAGLIAAGAELWDASTVLPHTNGVGRWLRTLAGYDDRPALWQVSAWLFYLLGAAWVATAGRSRVGLRRPQRPAVR
jgi:hypothetical protein